MKLKYSNKNDAIVSYSNLSPEDKKLFLITKFNTQINRKMLVDEEVFIQKGNYILGYKNSI